MEVIYPSELLGISSHLSPGSYLVLVASQAALIFGCCDYGDPLPQPWKHGVRGGILLLRRTHCLLPLGVGAHTCNRHGWTISGAACRHSLGGCSVLRGARAVVPCAWVHWLNGSVFLLIVAQAGARQQGEREWYMEKYTQIW